MPDPITKLRNQFRKQTPSLRETFPYPSHDTTHANIRKLFPLSQSSVEDLNNLFRPNKRANGGGFGVGSGGYLNPATITIAIPTIAKIKHGTTTYTGSLGAIAFVYIIGEPAPFEISHESTGAFSGVAWHITPTTPFTDILGNITGTWNTDTIGSRVYAVLLEVLSGVDVVSTAILNVGITINPAPVIPTITFDGTSTSHTSVDTPVPYASSTNVTVLTFINSTTSSVYWDNSQMTLTVDGFTSSISNTGTIEVTIIADSTSATKLVSVQEDLYRGTILIGTTYRSINFTSTYVDPFIRPVISKTFTNAYVLSNLTSPTLTPGGIPQSRMHIRFASDFRAAPLPSLMIRSSNAIDSPPEVSTIIFKPTGQYSSTPITTTFRFVTAFTSTITGQFTTTDVPWTDFTITSGSTQFTITWPVVAGGPHLATIRVPIPLGTNIEMGSVTTTVPSEYNTAYTVARPCFVSNTLGNVQGSPGVDNALFNTLDGWKAVTNGTGDTTLAIPINNMVNGFPFMVFQGAITIIKPGNIAISFNGNPPGNNAVAATLGVPLDMGVVVGNSLHVTFRKPSGGSGGVRGFIYFKDGP